MVGFRVRNLFDSGNLGLDGVRGVLFFEALVALDRCILLRGCLREICVRLALHFFLLDRIKLDAPCVLNKLPDEIADFRLLRGVVL